MKCEIFILTSLFFTITISRIYGAEIILENADRLETERKGALVNLFGSVVIRSGELVIKGNTASWDKNKNRVNFWGDVSLETSEQIVKTGELFYDGKRKEAWAKGGLVEVESKKGDTFARGELGFFNEKEKTAILWRNAYFSSIDTVDSGKIIVEADSFVHNSSSKLGKAYRVKKLEIFRKTGDKELTLSSDSLISFFDGESLHCFGNVRLFKDDIGARCGRLVYYRGKDFAFFVQEPVIVGKDWKLKGDTIFATLSDGKLNKVELHGTNSELTWTIDSLQPERTSSFYSNIMLFSFKNGKIEMAKLYGDVRSTYYVTEKETTNFGINFIKSDTSIIFITDEKLDSIIFIGNATGRYDRKTIPDSVFYFAKRVSYYPGEERITLFEESSLRYHALELQSYSISYFIDSYILVAEGFSDGEISFGTPIIKEGNDEFLANRLDYNLKTKKGHLYYGSTSKSSSHYFGKLIATTKENDLYIKSGRYTTCSLNDPHYHFYSPRIKYVEGNDRIIAKGVILYVKDLPVFALPFLVFSVDKRRHSGFLPVDIGNFVRGERFIRNIGYYLAPSPFWDYTIAVDFDELTGWLIRTKLNYALANYFSGSIAGSYKFESSDAITSIRKKSRWDLSVSHFETIYENYRLSFSGNFVSDRDYFYDTRYSPTERMTTNLSSNLLFSRNFRNSSLNISLTRIYNLVQNRITEDMPSIRFMRYQQPIISRGILKNFTFSYNGYFTRRRETNPWFNHWATSSEFRLSFPFNYNPYFNFSPGFNISTFLYDSDKTGKRYPFLSNLSMYTTLSTRLYGRSPAIFGQRIRHVLQPAITYSYSPERKNNLNLFTVGGISPYSSKINLLQWSVNNLFELISKNGKQKIELTSLSIQSGYNWENKTKPINDIITSARVEPFSNLNITLNSRFSWYSKDEKLKVPRFVEGGVTTSIFFGGNLSWGETLPQKEWRVNLYHYYTKQKSSIGETNWLKGDISLFLTPNWRVDYSIYYDIENNEKVSENITLWRDLHCWELTIGIIPSGYRAGFYFRINIKEIPDVKLEYGKGKVWGVF